jgi:hypothetical protein
MHVLTAQGGASAQNQNNSKVFKETDHSMSGPKHRRLQGCLATLIMDGGSNVEQDSLKILQMI